MTEQYADEDARRRKERFRTDSRPHVDGITRGTVIEYDDWQWAVVTEIAEEKAPTMVGFVLIDELGDGVVRALESAWGCWEHYQAVEAYRWSDHEYWTDISLVIEGSIWTVLGPIHPDARSEDQGARQ